MSNPYAIYKANYIDNLPSGVTYNSDIARFFYNGKRFFTPQAVEFYRLYLSKFASGPVDPGITGGVTAEYTDSNGDRWRTHTFDAGTDTLVVPVDATVDYLLVAGAGGGGTGEFDSGGGGGSGQVVYLTGQTFAASSYPVSVGAGGLGAQRITTNTNTQAGNGSNSTFNGQMAIGGGAGGSKRLAGISGWGSGGSASRSETNPGGVGPYKGGVSSLTTGINGAGGDGHSGDGEDGGIRTGLYLRDPGLGGPGVVDDADGRSISGVAVEYAKGGGGGKGYDERNVPALDGDTPGTGGEAGMLYREVADGDTERDGGDGADGILIVRYRIPTP